jgi:2-succinyl-5-enolpyruvyl-6-hydroxy-3-cyclohexene-1-carboxylate synthase
LTGPLLARELWDRVRPGALGRRIEQPRSPISIARPSPATERYRSPTEVAGIDGMCRPLRPRLAPDPSGLLGDVTFLHDIGGLLLAPGARRPPLQLVVLNDNGGGIFSLLEYGARAERGQAEAAVFDRVFGTPHTADLGALCQGYGVRHEIVQEIGRLRAVLADPAPGTSVIEIRADRSGLRGLHARIREVVRAAVETGR